MCYHFVIVEICIKYIIKGEPYDTKYKLKYKWEKWDNVVMKTENSITEHVLIYLLLLMTKKERSMKSYIWK